MVPSIFLSKIWATTVSWLILLGSVSVDWSINREFRLLLGIETGSVQANSKRSTVRLEVVSGFQDPQFFIPLMKNRPSRISLSPATAWYTQANISPIYRCGSWACISMGFGVPLGPPRVSASRNDLLIAVFRIRMISSIHELLVDC